MCASRPRGWPRVPPRRGCGSRAQSCGAHFAAAVSGRVPRERSRGLALPSVHRAKRSWADEATCVRGRRVGEVPSIAALLDPLRGPASRVDRGPDRLRRAGAAGDEVAHTPTGFV